MTYKVFWQSWLFSPAILGGALLASSSALASDGAVAANIDLSASEVPLETVITQPTEEPTVAATELMMAANLESKPESLAFVETEAAVPISELPRGDREVNVLEPINPYNHNSETHSLELIKKSSQLIQDFSPEVDASDGAVIEPSDEDSTDPLEQVTNVSQLRDVSPGDWAFEALRSLVERYGCIAGYPDGTYRGNRAISRYEFAAGLNACLQQIERLLGSGTGNLATQEDLTTVQRLIQEFGPELANLRGRVDGLEARTTELELTQFSTTTKLNAQAIFALTGIATGENALGGDIPNVIAFGDRVRLNFDTSFTGKDVLRTRLQAVNLDSYSGTSTFTPEGDLRFGDGTFGSGSNNNIGIDALLYAFPIGKKTTVVIEANAGAPDDFANTVNPFIDGDGDTGALSNFGTRNPIYGLVGGAGIGIRHEFSDALELSLGYLAGDAATPNEGSGLFDGAYGALAQITFKPINQLTLGLTYIHSYNADLTAGSNQANLRSALADNPNLPERLAPFAGLDLPVSSNSYGIQASWQFSPKFILGGWAGYTATRTLAPLIATDGSGSVLERGDMSIWNFAAHLAFPDLGKEGSVAAIIVGMEPKVTGASRSLRDAIGKDSDTSLHIEAFYEYKLTDNISITPGVIWLTAPDHNSNNDDIVIGAIRTTFNF
ncbi:MAG TPA: iron uptake porin [Stenomitos sp.]